MKQPHQSHDPSEFEPHLKKKKIEKCDDRVRVVFLDGLEKHYTQSLLQKRLCTPTLLCVKRARIYSLNEYKLEIERNIGICYKKRWIITSHYREQQFRVCDLDTGKILKVIDFPGSYSVMCVVENNNSNIMYIFRHNDDHLLKIDIENFTTLKIFGTKDPLFGLTFNKSKNELIGLAQDRIIVYDGDSLFPKYQKLYMESIDTIYYDENSDELCTFSLESGKYQLRKYYGSSLQFSKCHDIVSFDLDARVEPQLQWKSNNFILFYSGNSLLLLDRSNQELITEIPIKIHHLFFDNVTNTFFAQHGSKICQFELEIETFAVDVPLSKDICKRMLDINARLPKVLGISNGWARKTPLFVNYLRNIRLPRLHKFKYKRKGEFDISKVYDIATEEMIEFSDETSVHELIKFAPFELHKTNLKSTFRNRSNTFAIGSDHNKKFYIVVLLSELQEHGQYIHDFPIHIISVREGLEVAVQCKFSDFIKDLGTCITFPLTPPNREEAPEDTYEFEINPTKLYYLLGRNGHLEENDQLDSTILHECYQNIILNPGFETILRIVKIYLKDQTIKIHGHNYLLADLVVMAFGTKLIDFTDEDFDYSDSIFQN